MLFMFSMFVVIFVSLMFSSILYVMVLFIITTFILIRWTLGNNMCYFSIIIALKSKLTFVFCRSFLKYPHKMSSFSIRFIARATALFVLFILHIFWRLFIALMTSPSQSSFHMSWGSHGIYPFLMCQAPSLLNGGNFSIKSHGERS